MKLAAIALIVAGGMVIYFALHAGGNTNLPQPAPGQTGGPF